jgi:hypothetical protein
MRFHVPPAFHDLPDSMSDNPTADPPAFHPPAVHPLDATAKRQVVHCEQTDAIGSAKDHSRFVYGIHWRRQGI